MGGAIYGDRKWGRPVSRPGTGRHRNGSEVTRGWREVCPAPSGGAADRVHKGGSLRPVRPKGGSEVGGGPAAPSCEHPRVSGVSDRSIGALPLVRSGERQTQEPAGAKMAPQGR